jgi:hypothetical protein
MTLIEKFKEEYLKQTRELLSSYPEELHIFEELWTAGKLREAYIFVMESATKLDVKRSAENRKADEDFFWTYMHCLHANRRQTLWVT